MKIAVVILNWNGRALLEQFLPSVISNSYEAIVYVADNASIDDSVSYIKNNFPTVILIQNSENGGYAKGYNNALKHIEADVFCLLNNDVEVTSNWLQPVINEFESHLETAIAQPKILDYKNKSFFEYAGAGGGFIDKYGYPYCRGRIFNTIEKDMGQYDDTRKIFWASGACFFIKKKVFEELGGFDESYFAHMEEIDLCWRAFNAGHITKYIGTSTIYHLGGATLKNTNPKKTYLNFRNSLFTLIKNAKGHLFFIIIIRLLLDGFAALKFLFEFKLNHILSILKAHISFYSKIPFLMKQRKLSIQRKNYYNMTSIVWNYFVKQLKTFNCL